MMLTKILLLLCISLCKGHNSKDHNHYHNHFHDHDLLNSYDKTPRTCGSHTKSYQLMEESPDYKQKWELERQRGDAYVKHMKKSRDRSFRKKINHVKSNPDRKRLFSEYDDQIGNSPVVVIPIVFHVLYSNSDENLSDAQLQSQIDVLNKDFRALNDEIVNGEVDSIWDDRIGDTKFEFYINQTIRVPISDPADICLDENLLKVSASGGSDGLDPSIYLNTWICDISSEGLLGYAYQPCLLGTSTEYLDGVVLNTQHIGSADDDDGTFYFGSGINVYNLGRTGTHEVGHYFNLDHIWGTSSAETCSDSDSVSDTPNQLADHSACPDDTTNTCTENDPETGTDLRDNYENYMDYVYDACMFMFTEEQVWRMRAVISGTGCRRKMYYNGAQLENGQTLQPSSESVVIPTSGSYECSDGCVIPEDYVNDYYCDCIDCGDEADWGCGTCSSQGCPTYCGDYILCDGTGTGTADPTQSPTPPTPPPTSQPTGPSNSPTPRPTLSPSDPTIQPTYEPTSAPVNYTMQPSNLPTQTPNDITIGPAKGFINATPNNTFLLVAINCIYCLLYILL